MYILWGYLNFQSSSNAGSRCLRFGYNGSTSFEFEIQGNSAGYTQIQVPFIVINGGNWSSNEITLQARQASTNTITVSGVLRAVKVGLYNT